MNYINNTITAITLQHKTRYVDVIIMQESHKIKKWSYRNSVCCQIKKWNLSCHYQDIYNWTSQFNKLQFTWFICYTTSTYWYFRSAFFFLSGLHFLHHISQALMITSRAMQIGYLKVETLLTNTFNKQEMSNTTVYNTLFSHWNIHILEINKKHHPFTIIFTNF